MLSVLSGRFRRITTNQLYFPEIDGIRFVAISLVILYHIYKYFISHTSIATTAENGNFSLLNTFIDNSDRGVELFFVLSGFILCLPFAHYHIGNGKKVQLKHYYLRRVTRLEPPYFIALTGIFMLQVLFRTRSFSEMWPSWLASMGYAHMFVFHTIPSITIVTWSLEIEIQFYLLAPLLFNVLSFDKFTRRLSLLIAIIGIILLQNFFPLAIISLCDYAQFFCIGILLADFYVTDDLAPLFRKKRMVPVAVISLFVLLYLPIKSGIPDFYTLLWARLCFPFTIFVFCYAVFKNALLIKAFSYRFVPIIGGMCYSIYLLHYTIIGITGRLTNSLHFGSSYLPNLFLQIVLHIVPILIISALFYYFVERPFMSRKWVDMLLKREKEGVPTAEQA